MHKQLNPLLRSLPDWVTDFRTGQVDAIARVVDAFDRVDLVIVDAPTGSGKTLIGETVGKIMDVSRTYVCSSKGLQAQFVRDFPYAKLLQGRANYPTRNYPDRFHPESFPSVSCEDCTWSLSKSCNLCDEKFACPYEQAKNSALAAEVAVLNTAYLLTEANNVGKFSDNDLVIVDEADTLESTLMNHVSVEIGERRLEHFAWEPPDRVTVEDSWDQWLGLRIAELGSIVAGLPDTFDSFADAREARYLTRLLSSLQSVRDGLPSNAWAYTGRGNNDPHGRGVSFRPARVDHLGQSHVWRHGHKWLLMTATPISSQEMVESLGWEGRYETVRVKSTFPIQNRRVFYRGKRSMSFKEREGGAWDDMGNAIIEDLKRHVGERVLIHTVSYALTEHLTKMLRSAKLNRRIVSYRNAMNRDAALKQYLDTEGSVLVAPSMGRGVDLPGDACRVQMITKVPFPYLKDRQVSKRLHSRGGQLWYNVQTIREVVQMCGRAIRSDTDWAVTYIYDSDFRKILWEKRALFPDWFREAIVWSDR